MESYKCYLECEIESHSPILLPHLERVQIGRSPVTRIKDTRVSRKHVELTADCIRQRVRIVQLGNNPSKIVDTELQKGATAKLKKGEVIQILTGHFPHRVSFKLENQNGQKAKMSHKRQRSIDNSENESASKRTKSTENKPTSDSDEEHTKAVEERLRKMRETVKVSPVKADKIHQGASDDGGGCDTDDRLGEPHATPSWTEIDTLMVHKSRGLRASSKIAAFDIDGTIIGTQSGKVFPTHPGDWRILYPEIPGTLKKLQADGFKIVFITNQMGIQRGKVKVPDFQQKVENIIAKLGVSVHVLVSKGAGPYRKPGLGMWKHLSQKDNDGIKVNKSKSIYIGDAAGRPKDWLPKKKKDFSCSDRLFALNAGLKFQTPEEYFLKQKAAKYNMPEFDPRRLDPNAPLLSPTSAKLTSGQQEVIVLVGSPASGKSVFAEEHLVTKGYVHVNRDTQKTWQKCVELTKQSLSSGKCVVVDNTNPDVESRKRYTDVAKKAGVTCRCFVLNTSPEHARHNERFREMTDKSHQPINDMVMNSYKSKFTEPTTAEDFSEIVKVNFVIKFEDKEQEKLYRLFLMDK